MEKLWVAAKIGLLMTGITKQVRKNKQEKEQ